LPTKRISKDAELAKIQIYAEQRHTVVSVMASAIFAVLISFAVVFYTLYFQKNITPTVFGVSLTVLYSASFAYVVKIVADYKEDLKRMSDMMEAIKEGKELPRLDELSKWERKKP